MKPIDIISRKISQIKEIMIKEGIPAVSVDSICPDCGETLQVEILITQPNTQPDICLGTGRLQ